MARYTFRDPRLTEEQLSAQIAPFILKLVWFKENGYEPHYYQLLFHTFTDDQGHLCRFRHLVAGRRGGKTLSAAWEVVYYALHPEQYWWDAHGKENDDPLHVWAVSPDYPMGRAALLTIRKVLREAGLRHGIDYRENRGQKYIEFTNGSLIEFKTADDPQSLRGAGLDILWIDESAFIPNSEAYYTAYPATSDKKGLILTTTTPFGRNWIWDEFWSDEALADPKQARVEYRSIDNPFFDKEEWEEAKRRLHPMIFAREYEASFDAMAGRELSGDWLHFYVLADLPRKPNYEKAEGLTPESLDLAVYIGVDPAVSLADQANSFSLAVIGVTRDSSRVYLLELLKEKIPFPDQVRLIEEYHLKWRPMLIGVESTAYQAALAQQLMRLPSLPAIMEIPARGKKEERILSMAPLFKVGKVLIRKDHRDFIDEWLNYDPTIKNPKDDALDAVEIALRTAGALLPELPDVDLVQEPRPAADMNELAARRVPKMKEPEDVYWDDDLGLDW